MGTVSLLEEVYVCDCCPESYGFSRPGAGQPYFKFPPIIGAAGPADILFVGINPRISASNRDLHERLAADYRAFHDLSRNWDGDHRYIAPDCREEHYRSHVRIVEGVFGEGAKFESHAAVTELFLCASKDSARLPIQERPCAARFLQRVVQQVRPKVVVAVGFTVHAYLLSHLRSLSDTAAGLSAAARRSAFALVLIEHPRRKGDGIADDRMREAIETIRARLGKTRSMEQTNS
jgi:uracil-DNA glycosylase